MAGSALADQALFGTAVLAAFVWSSYFLTTLAYRRRVVFLADLPAAPPPGGWPSLAVVFAARNEARAIENAARSMLGLAFPGVTIVAVNDRSTDATGPILRELAREHGHLRVVDVETLPPGWLGKNHALMVGATGLATDWLLFTDADIVFSPDAVKKAVAHAVQGGLDFVTVFPGMSYDTPFERMFVAYFGVLLGLKHPPWGVEDRKSRVHLGVGAFNLVRRSAFARIGGFTHLRLSVDDDIRLAEALKAHGYRLQALQGAGALSLKWQSDIGAYIRGFEKNAFASLGFNLGGAAAAFVMLLAIGTGPFLAVAFGDPIGKLLGAVAIAAIAGLMARARRSFDVHPGYALAAPLATAFLALALVGSVGKTLQRRGVVWRDHHYPLRELKAHVVERRKWLGEAWRATKARGFGPPAEDGRRG